MGSTETVVMYLVFLEIDGAKHRILQLNALMGFRINLNGTIRGEHSKLIFGQSWDFVPTGLTQWCPTVPAYSSLPTLVYNTLAPVSTEVEEEE